jgi:hypothetical protein
MSRAIFHFVAKFLSFPQILLIKISLSFFESFLPISEIDV